jgi:hypothetical protein
MARSMSAPSAAQLVETPGALLTRSHLRELGLERRAVDAVFLNSSPESESPTSARASLAGSPPC